LRLVSRYRRMALGKFCFVFYKLTLLASVPLAKMVMPDLAATLSHSQQNDATR
jgi:hypothetical protein